MEKRHKPFYSADFTQKKACEKNSVFHRQNLLYVELWKNLLWNVKKRVENHSFTFLIISSTIAFSCILTSSFALISLSA